MTGSWNRSLVLSALVLLVAGLVASEPRDVLLDHRANNAVVVQPTEAKYSKHAFWYAQARFARNKDAEAIALIDDALARMSTSDQDTEDPWFQYWAAMDCYLRWQDRLPQATIDTLKDRMADWTHWGSGYTPNHKLMARVARSLAAQSWPAMPFASDVAGDDPHGRSWLLDEMAEIAESGLFHEADSDTYVALSLAPLLTLAEFSSDEQLASRARFTHEILLLNAAADWLDGHLVASSARHRKLKNRQDEYGASDAFYWLHFGGPDPNNIRHPDIDFAVQVALSPYRVPDILRAIATDRAAPVVVRERARSSTDYLKTSYLTDDFGLFSQFEPGTPLKWTGLLQRWGIVWRHASEDSMLWLKHPYSSGSTIKGGTDAGDTFQHRDTVLATYVIPSDADWQELRGYVPAGHAAMIDETASGRLYLDYGSALVALAVSAPITWVDATAIRVDAQQVAVLGVVGDPDHYAGESDRLQAFADDLALDQRLDVTIGPTPQVRFTKPDGTALRLEHRTLRSVDGNAVDPADWPLHETPWFTRSNHSETTFTVVHGSTRRTYDRSTWTITNQNDTTAPDAPAGLSATPTE